MPDVAIREARTLDDIRAMRRVFESVWGASGVPALNVFRAIQHAGGYLTLADDDGDVLAASLGFLGRDGDGELLLHSHITATTHGLDNRGIGFALKQHQRSWCLARGIATIAWTFDPLVRRNAFFNLSKLGARATEYHADFYGDMADALNAGDESDRIVASWDLRREHPVDREAPDGAALVLDVDADGAPSVTDATGSILLYRVPSAVPEGARRGEWRRAVRHTLGAAIADGFVGTGVTTDGAYVLRRGAAQPR